MLIAEQIVIDNFNPRPREEGDGSYRDNVGAPINFNPRPREEGDSSFPTLEARQHKFQSTPS